MVLSSFYAQTIAAPNNLRGVNRNSDKSENGPVLKIRAILLSIRGCRRAVVLELRKAVWDVHFPPNPELGRPEIVLDDHLLNGDWG